MSHGINKVTAERNQRALLELVQKPGNDICADCKARAPRWASHNLGIFICMNCASVHRKMGTHISKVKSINMDTWSKDQVEVMKQNGNVKSNSYYNPDEIRNPPPTNMIERERDSELEKYIRSKYEFKRFIDRSAPDASQPVPPRSSSNEFPSAPQSKSSLARSSAAGPSPNPPRSDSLGYRPSTTVGVKPASRPSQSQPNRSVSQPLPPPQHAPPPSSAPQKPSSNPVWDDLISLQTHSESAALPLQYQPNTQTPGSVQPITIPSASPYTNAMPFGQAQMTSPIAISAPVNGLDMGSVGMNPNIGGGIGGGIGMGGTNPFQQPNFNAAAFAPVAGSFSAPNPFTQPYLSSGATNTASPFTGMGGGQSLRQTSSSFKSHIPPFSQTPAAQQFQASLQSQSQPQSFFQPQPQPPVQQVQQPFGQQPSPFGQQPSPYGQQQPSPFGQQPSPFGHQPSPQIQQPQQAQQMFSPGNPFNNWQQQAGGYSGAPSAFGGQQWGGM